MNTQRFSSHELPIKHVFQPSLFFFAFSWRLLLSLTFRERIKFEGTEGMSIKIKFIVFRCVIVMFSVLEGNQKWSTHAQRLSELKFVYYSEKLTSLEDVLPFSLSYYKKVLLLLFFYSSGSLLENVSFAIISSCFPSQSNLVFNIQWSLILFIFVWFLYK